MSRNNLIILAFVVIILIAGVIYLTRTPETAVNSSDSTENEKMEQNQNGETDRAAPNSNETENIINNEIAKEQAVVIYGENGFEPRTLTVKKGTTVIFKNEKNGNMWVASAMHPSHEVYPEKGGCISSAFDACKGYIKGESWPFQFNVVGTWRYHDHLNASQFGSVAVTE